MASKDYINKVVDIINEYHGIHKFKTKDIFPPVGATRAFIVNNADPTTPIDGVNNAFVVQLRDGEVDVHCRSSEIDNFGFNNIDDFYRWLENKVYGRESEVGRPHSALAATVATKYKGQ